MYVIKTVSQRDSGNSYRSIARSLFKDGQPKDRIPDWMDDTDLFVLGVTNTYAVVNEQFLREFLSLEQENDRYLDLENTTFNDVQVSVQKLVDQGVLDYRHHGYWLTDTGQTYVSEFSGWPTASGFLSKHRRPAIVFAIGMIVAWILSLPVSTGVCQQIGFPDAYTCGLSAVILFISSVPILILLGYGRKVAREAVAFINTDVRYPPRINIEEETYKTAMYSRLADAVPTNIIIIAVVFTLFLLIFDLFIVGNKLNNQIYGLAFDGFGGYLLAKSEFLRGNLRLSRGSNMQMERSSNQALDVFDGAFGLSLLILGFSLQFAAIFPALKLSNLIWAVIESIVRLFLNFLPIVKYLG